jgi:aspartyl-tRNA(Asn)/glutamyl-tRNA(Gln) amidotransferase subunit C
MSGDFMPATITIDDVKKIARLSKLEFSEDEERVLAKQLGDIVGYIEKLNELDTENVAPTSHVLNLRNVFRKDEVKQWLTQEEVLENAPVKKNGYFSVPKVIG